MNNNTQNAINTNTNEIVTVNLVGACFIPEGYAYEDKGNKEVVIIFQGEVIGQVKSAQSAKTFILRHVERQFRTRIENTWSTEEDPRYYPQYWANGRWHSVKDAKGKAVYLPTEYEAKMRLLIFLNSQNHRELIAVEPKPIRKPARKGAILLLNNYR